MSTPCAGCAENIDPLKLVREGTDKVRRRAAALDPSHVPVDGRRAEHAMVFATAYAEHLTYFDLADTAAGHWQELFATDVSAQLAVVAVEDVTVYRSTVKELLGSLEDPELPASGPDMTRSLGELFDCLGTLARRIDALKEGLPAEQPLRATLRNLVQGQLAPMLRRLIGYHLAGQALGVVNPALPPPDATILGRPVESFSELLGPPGLSDDWARGVGVADWTAYVSVAAADHVSAYGPGATDVEQVNHLAGHNLFRAVCETFLAVLARVVDEAEAEIDATFTWDGHEPHYALFLAFLKLLEHARAEVNTLSARHLDFYYRRVLQLAERPAQPGRAHVVVELAKHAAAVQLTEGTLLKAGKDDTGADAHFSIDRELVANKAAVADLRRTYRHRNTATESLPHDQDRIFATAIDTTEEFHPFAEKTYVDGALTAVDMAPAEVGFAIASHQLWLAGGARRITVDLQVTVLADALALSTPDLVVRLSTEKGWLDVALPELNLTDAGLQLVIDLDGNAAPITPYDPEVHGYGFDTAMPVLLVLLRHRADATWDYAQMEGLRIDMVRVQVHVEGLKALALSNDHGPIDPSKPFLPYGSAPGLNSSLVIGSKEVFQKQPSTVTLNATKMADAVASGTEPTLSVDYLDRGVWQPFPRSPHSGYDQDVNFQTSPLHGLPLPEVAEPDLTPDEHYSTTSRHGFVRLRLSGGFGTDSYPVELAKYIAGKRTTEPTRPVLPALGGLSVDYDAGQTVELGAPTPGTTFKLFHVAPFGHTEVSATQPSAPLLPQLTAGSAAAEGELLIGVAGLAPPQDLALLFQVVDGTANPLVVKPEHHLDWTYLRGDDWVAFPADAVADGTDGLLASGIATVAVPEDADTDHRVLPSGLHWIRVAVASGSDAVCRLVAVVAQAASASYVVPASGSAPQAHEQPAGTITKLDTPDAAVKGITQPHPTFGGRPPETTVAFATRVSERLRHKDRGIALWDYEHLVLEAFPGIYQARCLNHTRYEPNSSGTGIYRELAPGHVTVVTIPDLEVPDPRDPLRPFTSLRVLGQIEQFLAQRVSCFAKLHVRNPQFEEVRVDLRVRLREGVDETFHLNRLKTEITRFLSPWAFRGDARPTFNGKVRKSVLVDFVEERDYVDYVTDVRLFRRLPGATADGPDLEEVVGSRAVSILVSVPAEQHNLTAIHPAEVLVSEPCACGPSSELLELG